MLNRAIPWTRSPVVIRPSEISQEPKASERDRPDRRQALEHRLERAPEPSHVDAGRPQLLGRGPQPVDLLVAATEGLHHEGPVEALVHDPRDGTDLLLHLLGRPLDALRVEPVEQAERREQRQRQKHEPEVDQCQADHGEEDERHHADGERHRAHDLGGGQHVAVGVGQELAGRSRSVEVERDVEVGVGDPPSPVRLHAERGQAAVVATQDDRHRLQEADREQRQRAGDDRALAHPFGERRQDHVLGDPAQHDGRADRRRRVERRAGHGQGEPTRLLPHVPADDPHAAPEQRGGAVLHCPCSPGVVHPAAIVPQAAPTGESRFGRTRDFPLRGGAS